MGFAVKFLVSQLTLVPAILAEASAAIKVFGHKSPDTDTIISAMVYAWELNERKINATAHRLGELNPETEFVLKTLGLQQPPLLSGALEKKEAVAVVDTNNPEELPEGITSAKIHSIVDHHKLSGLSNAEPLEIDMRPLCSAGSILYARAKAYNLKVPKEIAGLMLSGLLSDSLEFRSPTTTDVDKEFAKELGQIAGLDVHKHAEGMLEAKAQVDHLTPMELVKMDSKIFNIGGKKLRVSVLETTKPDVPLKKRDDLIKAQKELVTSEKLDDCLFFVVDIIKEVATFLSSSPTSSGLVEQAWATKVGADGTVELPGVLSRKKQIIPALEKAAAKAEL
mmetsp:Transcript_60274/g.143643  ORF Transcript_60274/g.143643 Transcript_60274/m.143643 type:complete len:337 (-) Transcript_60274:159-1169(-)|eukprot:CAMPEP_0178415034 /NCGR_PEP_ID=MMETSP0689_2-20121128/23343_1 /TAXON_ID=160604 /ORGANISM="Amphidinium massartii, Strain CS-259" /LENGTH=336 /DNA_ID=CAMNT_0020036341 /DNA_START=108 /DNA_END=1118 /DNA_ORIENTATION=+